MNQNSLLVHIFKGFNNYKKRTILSLLGIVVSVCFYIVSTLLVNVIIDLQTEKLNSFCQNSLYINYYLNDSTMNELETKMTDVKISNFSYSSGYVVSETYDDIPRVTTVVTLVGVESDFYNYPLPSEDVSNLISTSELLYGRTFSEEDILLSRNVAIMHYSYAKLFFDDNPLGKTIQLRNNSEFEIIGILKDTDDVIRNVDKIITNQTIDLNYLSIYIPQKLIAFSETQKTIITFNGVDMNSAYNEVSKIIDSSVISYNMYYYDMLMIDMLEEVEYTVNLLNVLLITMIILTGFSLLAILMFSFKERIIEVGIKKSIGASEGEILNQFMIENIIIGIAGAVIGIFISLFLLIIIIPIFLSLDTNIVLLTIDLKTIISAFLLALIICLAFGFIPTILILRKNIVNVLRTE